MGQVRWIAKVTLGRLSTARVWWCGIGARNRRSGPCCWITSNESDRPSTPSPLLTSKFGSFQSYLHFSCTLYGPFPHNLGPGSDHIKNPLDSNHDPIPKRKGGPRISVAVSEQVTMLKLSRTTVWLTDDNGMEDLVAYLFGSP